MYSSVSVPVASVIWSWSVGCCWLFYCLCMSLCLSAQLYSSPHSAAVRPHLPLLSLSPSVYATESLIYSAHPSTPFSPTAPPTHTHAHTYTSSALRVKHRVCHYSYFFFPSFFFFHTCFFSPLAFIDLHIFLTSHHLLGSVLFPHALFPRCFLNSVSLYQHRCHIRAPSSVPIL